MDYENFKPEQLNDRDKTRVVAYESFWSYKEPKGDDGFGGVLLKLDNRTNARLRSTDANVVNYWSSILRDEKPVYYHSSAKVLITGLQDI